MGMLRCALVVCTVLSAAGADGAASPIELQRLYQRYFQQKDEQKLASLVYWQGVEQRDRDSFTRSLRTDLNQRLQKVEFVPLDAGLRLEYTRDGIAYAPSLPPIGRLVASYEDQGNVTHLTTSYLVGMKDGRYYIVLAAPKRDKTAQESEWLGPIS